MILFLDHNTPEASFLLHSLREAGCAPRAVYLEDDGFLPEEVSSPYRFWCQRQRQTPSHPRYFDRLEVPDGWEIRSTGAEGSIWDYDRQRARIHYAPPADRRYIQSVDWLDESGNTIWTDHYDDEGSLFARTACDAKGRPVLKSYYAKDGTEAITENLQSHVILLRDQTGKSTASSEQGASQVDRNFIFRNKTEFVLHYLKAAGADCERILLNSLSYPLFVQRRLRADAESCGKKETDGKDLQAGRSAGQKNGDLLFWQEDIYGKLPGNMVAVMNDPRGIGRIVVQSPGVLDKILDQLHAHAEENGIRDPERAERMVTSLGYLYPVENPPKQERSICILTNSDAIEKLDELTAALPDYVFHIGALTEMSDRLLRMQKKNNVRLYPGMTGSRARELVSGCEFCLDINHGSEVMDTVREAYLSQTVILAFQETRHNAMFTADRNTFAAADWEKMAETLRRAAASAEERRHLLKLQDGKAMRAAVDEYSRIVGGCT